MVIFMGTPGESRPRKACASFVAQNGEQSSCRATIADPGMRVVSAGPLSEVDGKSTGESLPRCDILTTSACRRPADPPRDRSMKPLLSVLGVLAALVVSSSAAGQVAPE